MGGHGQPVEVVDEALCTALHRNIQDVFNEHDIQIMTPAYVGDPPEPKLVPRGQWYTPPAVAPPAAEGDATD